MDEDIARARVEILVVGYANSPSVAGTVGLVRDGDAVIVVDPGMVKRRSLILDPLERLGISPDDVTHVFVSHHHLDHTVNIALFRQAEIVDFRTVRRDDQVNAHQGEGFKLGPNTRIWVTPGHSPRTPAWSPIRSRVGRLSHTCGGGPIGLPRSIRIRPTRPSLPATGSDS
jgi:glyoxylase-like metal-dependent hydrolase (beta-lactamase superfamily II)